MRYLLVTFCLCISLLGSVLALGSEKPVDESVVELVVFSVSDPVEGMKAARAIVADAKAFNDAIISAELYQSASNPNLIAQRIIWNSLTEAKAAIAASEKFPGMVRIMELTTEQVLFDHFYLK